MANISFDTFLHKPVMLFKQLKQHFRGDDRQQQQQQLIPYPPPWIPTLPRLPIPQNLLCQIVRDSPDLRQPIQAKPVHLCDFWLDRGRNIHIGRDGFKYYDHKAFTSKTKLDFRLSDGISTFDPRPLDEGLNNILNYLLHVTEPNTPLKAAVKNADFVCFRGTLTALAVTPYSHDDTGFKFAIFKFQGVFFIMQLDTDAILEERANETKRSKLLTYWGQKFETYIFASKGQQPDTKSPVSTWNETLAAFQMTLKPAASINKPVNLFYCAEIDGLDKENGRHIEAKTAEKINLSKAFAAQKFLKWWIQSYLAGINKIVVGTRSHHGIVKKLEWLKLSDIKYKHRMHWDSNVCMQSVYRILNNIREFYDSNVRMDEMLVIERKPSSSFIHYSKGHSTKYPVLTPEFRKFFENAKPMILAQRRSILGRPEPFSLKRKFLQNEIQNPPQFYGESWRPPPQKKPKFLFFN